jgi:hypothetical protein
MLVSGNNARGRAEEIRIMGRWLVIGFIALVVALGLGAYFSDRDWDRDWDDDRAAQVITTQSGETIVIERDRHFFPFPFLIFPLLLIGLVWFLASRRRWDGGGPWGGNPDWMREWHEREHRAMDSRAGPPSDTQPV